MITHLVVSLDPQITGTEVRLINEWLLNQLSVRKVGVYHDMQESDFVFPKPIEGSAFEPQGESVEDFSRRFVRAMETIASAVKDGVVQMKDVDRAKVYSEHLGKKLQQNVDLSDPPSVAASVGREPIKHPSYSEPPCVTDEDVKNQEGRG